MNIKFMLVLKYINGSPADIISIHGILTGTHFIERKMGETNTSRYISNEI